MSAFPESRPARPARSGPGGVIGALAARADRSVTVAGDGGTRMDAAALLGWSRRVAADLRDGSGPVGLLAGNGPAWVAADLGIMLAGRPCVPLPTFFSPAQIGHVLAAAGIRQVIGEDPAVLENLRPAGGIRVGREGGLLLAALEPVAMPTLPAGTAKITFTSGTTGQPKGVCLGQGQLELTARALAEAIGTLDVRRHLSVLPLSTLLENVAGVYGALMSEAECLLPPLETLGIGFGGIDLPRFMHALARLRPESLILVPELLEALVRGAEAGLPRPRTLRFVAVGGARVSRGLLDRAAAAGLPVYEGYGLSECGSVVALNRPGARRPGSVGRPLPHLSVSLAGDGEILVRGGRMAGYLGEPGVPGGDAQPTGDLGGLDEDGFLYVHGRKDNLIITSHGRNLSPEWLEAELAQQPGIGQAVVFGEARPWPVALLVPRPGEQTPSRAVSRVNGDLPEYARIRAWLIADGPFTAGNGLATANGRPRRDRIAARYADRIEGLYAEATRAGGEVGAGLGAARTGKQERAEP